PSQLDTWDLKPDAPSGIRSEFKPIPTNVSGVQICEHFRHLAQQADQFAIIRSMSHSSTGHGSGVYYFLTGHPYTDPNVDPPPRADDFPALASVLAKFHPSPRALPTAVTVPRWCRFNCQPHVLAGQKAGFLGGSYDPWLIDAEPSDPRFRIDSLQLPVDVSL